MFFAPVELSEQRRDEMVEQAAQAVVRRRLESPALVALEMTPLSVIGANLVMLSTPLAGPFLGWRFCDELAFFMMDRSNVARLAKRIEALAAGSSSNPQPATRNHASEGPAR
ncbi:MAG TPA: hypothetical protein PK280_04010 [Planctomycetota bacterium]|nr:hypothetical protein [Planctomycetota bacterium]